ncbi:MAG: DUF2332 domain-containing protein [Actinomycetota bacterium]|nr:DUF2332 domain-containing protein [Actinomycetota bacterium]
MLDRAADDLERGGPVAGALAGHGDAAASMPALRLMGAVHRLVLAGEAPALAAHFPSAGGDGDPAAAWPAFRDLLAERRDRVGELVPRPVQTNEPGRCAALLGGLLLAEARGGHPLRLLEVGASAGLNLHPDRFGYASGEARWGDPGSAVQLTDVFAGTRRPRRRPLRVAERAGSDPEPLDPGSEEDRQSLRAYVWANMAERLRRLEAALDLAAAPPERVERAGAGAWLGRRLERPVEGRTTVVVHTIVMQYVTEGERAEVDALLEAAGAWATPRAPLARLSMEPGGARADVRLRLWPGGEEQLVARSGYHGPPVEWLG